MEEKFYASATQKIIDVSWVILWLVLTRIISRFPEIISGSGTFGDYCGIIVAVAWAISLVMDFIRPYIIITDKKITYSPNLFYKREIDVSQIISAVIVGDKLFERLEITFKKLNGSTGKMKFYLYMVGDYRKFLSTIKKYVEIKP